MPVQIESANFDTAGKAAYHGSLSRTGGAGRRLCLQLSRYEDVDQVRGQYDHSWALATYGAAVTISHVTQAEAESNFPLLFSIIIRAMSGKSLYLTLD